MLNLLKIIIQSKIISPNHFLTHSSLCDHTCMLHIHSMHTRGSHLCHFTLRILHGSLWLTSLGNAALHLSVLWLGFHWDYFFIGRGVGTGPNILWSTGLPCPGIHLRSFIEGVPLDAGVSCALQTFGVVSRVHVALYSFQQVVHRQNTMIIAIQRPNPCIPDAGQSSIIYLAMSWYLKGSWFLVVWVPHLRE